MTTIQGGSSLVLTLAQTRAQSWGDRPQGGRQANRQTDTRERPHARTDHVERGRDGQMR